MATVVLTTCSNSVEANIIKNKLENHGITCFLANEHFADLMPHYNGILGAGVQIIIKESDLVKAQKLVKEQPEDDEIVCPQCRSSKVRFNLGNNKAKKVFVVIFSILLWIPFGNIKLTYICYECKYEFKR